ncbi:hypothetical protein ACH492_36690 [Streptomyces sp. NPDC019443]|uniref:hypothetical protein n=1 Tax=Streptomyces sp. NPDC019443 TaxID=3365061 RepID=UPI00378ECA84
MERRLHEAVISEGRAKARRWEQLEAERATRCAAAKAHAGAEARAVEPVAAPELLPVVVLPAPCPVVLDLEPEAAPARRR